MNNLIIYGIGWHRGEGARPGGHCHGTLGSLWGQDNRPGLLYSLPKSCLHFLPLLSLEEIIIIILLFKGLDHGKMMESK